MGKVQKLEIVTVSYTPSSKPCSAESLCRWIENKNDSRLISWWWHQ